MMNAREPAAKFPAGLNERYCEALRLHLCDESGGNTDGARNCGQFALANGFAAADLARIHEATQAALASSPDFSGTRKRSLKRAGFFFTQALIPLEAARRSTQRANLLLLQRNETLRLHNAKVAKVNRALGREVARRETAEATIRKGKDRYQKLFAESQLTQRKLRQLAHQVLAAQEEERKEISRELHDEVVQALVGINVQLATLHRGAGEGAQVLQQRIARTQRLVEKSVKAVHRFARELRPAVLDDLGLIPALHAYCKSLGGRKKIRIRLTAFAGVEALAGTERTVLFRVAQDALTNVVRHAEATLVRLTIVEVAGVVRMEVADDGKSFPLAATLLAKTPRCLGLIAMKERIEMVGGTFGIESALGKGTTVRFEIPFRGPRTKK